MSLGTRLFTWLNGAAVGTDAFGNRYFRDKKRVDGYRERRWVIYKGEPEASKVPPEWHAWLHHISDETPPEGGVPGHAWQKPHMPNLTGTDLAYRPPGHTLQGGQRARTTADYEPWRPA